MLVQQVRYVDTPPEWKHIATGIGLDPYLVAHLVAFYKDFQRGNYRGVNDNLATIGKGSPLTLEDFVRRAWPEPDRQSL